MAHDEALVARVLADARDLVRGEIAELVARRRATGYGPLYDLVADYPLREGKGLRPAICLSAAIAAGGQRDQALGSATALELLHNGFLVHDDIEDASTFRRGRATLFADRGVPVAINVGDATNILCHRRPAGERLDDRCAQVAAGAAGDRADGPRVGRGAGHRARLDPPAARSTSRTATTCAWPTRRPAGTR